MTCRTITMIISFIGQENTQRRLFLQEVREMEGRKVDLIGLVISHHAKQVGHLCGGVHHLTALELLVGVLKVRHRYGQVGGGTIRRNRKNE